jgi:hypothetical protein
VRQRRLDLLRGLEQHDWSGTVTAASARSVSMRAFEVIPGRRRSSGWSSATLTGNT